MSTTIELRDVPDDLHRQLTSRAARAGKSLSDYLLVVFSEIAARPTPDEMTARLETLPPVEPDDA